MRQVIIIMLATGLAACGGANFGTDPKPVPDSPVIPFGSINLNRSASISLDACLMQDGYPMPSVQHAINLLKGYGITIYTDKITDYYVDCKPDLGTGIVGNTYRYSHTDISNIFFTLDADTQTHAFAHEMGHMLGANHVGSPNSLMYPYVDSNLLITDDDVESIEEMGFQ